MDEIRSEDRLYLSEEAVSHLAVMRKWALFLSVLGFIGCAFIILLGLFFALIMKFGGQSGGFQAIPSMVLAILYVGIGVLYFFPSYFLLRFSTNAKLAIAGNAELPLTKALKNLRSHFAFLGIAAIAVVAGYILFLVGVIVFAVFKAASTGG